MEGSESNIRTAEIWVRHATLQNVYSEVLLAARGQEGNETTEVVCLKTGFHKIISSGDPLIVASPRA